MTLKDQITEAMKTAMRNKDKERLGAIRLILSEIKRVEVDERIEVADNRILAILDKMAKQRKDSISQFQTANREDLVAIEQKELDVIADFLPEALSEGEIKLIIQDAVTKTGAATMQDMGKVMELVKPQVQGRADMGTISQLVKAALS